jgi:hypothetical protein
VSVASGRTRIGGALIRWEHRYGLLLALILCSLVFQLAAPDEGWAREVTIALQGGTLLFALVASEVRPLVVRLAALVVGAAVLASAGVEVGAGLGASAARVVAVLFAALAPVAIFRGVVRGVRQDGGVTTHTMFGVLCIYLLLGTLFAYAYALLGDAQAGPFFAEQAGADIRDYLYFSFVTVTTTGYGDLTAASDVGRSMAIAEALLGQIYLVTVVAVIVGNLGRRRAAG